MSSSGNSAAFRALLLLNCLGLETEQTYEQRSVAAPHRRPLNVYAFAVVIVIPTWQLHQSPAECCYFYINPHSPQLNIRIKAALFCLKGQCYFYSPNDESPLKTRTRCGSFLTHVLQLSGCLSCVCTERPVPPHPPHPHPGFRSVRRIQ